MKPLAAIAILAGLGNLIYFPLHLTQSNPVFSWMTSAGASVLGVFLLVSGVGTWQRRLYGWKSGFAAIFAASLWCAAASAEMALRHFPQPTTALMVAITLGALFILVGLYPAALWKDRRPWFGY